MKTLSLKNIRRGLKVVDSDSVGTVIKCSDPHNIEMGMYKKDNNGQCGDALVCLVKGCTDYDNSWKVVGHA